MNLEKDFLLPFDLETFSVLYLTVLLRGLHSPTVRTSPMAVSLKHGDRIPEVVELFNNQAGGASTTRQGWNNCRNEKYGYGNEMAEQATACGEAYTKDEAKAMKFYGARYDAFKCLTWELGFYACHNAYLNMVHT